MKQLLYTMLLAFGFILLFFRRNEEWIEKFLCGKRWKMLRYCVLWKRASKLYLMNWFLFDFNKYFFMLLWWCGRFCGLITRSNRALFATNFDRSENFLSTRRKSFSRFSERFVRMCITKPSIILSSLVTSPLLTNPSNVFSINNLLGPFVQLVDRSIAMLSFIEK